MSTLDQLIQLFIFEMRYFLILNDKIGIENVLAQRKNAQKLHVVLPKHLNR